MRFQTKSWIFLSIILLFFGYSHAAAQVPEKINYQGYLTDDMGTPVPDADYSITFSLYDDSSALLWREIQTTVMVSDGVFNVQIGQDPTGNPFPVFDSDMFLGVKVGTDPEMTPRQVLSSVPFALKSADSDTFDGNLPSAFSLSSHDHDSVYINEGQLGSITGSMLKDGSSLSEILDDDGPGSELNADYLDGYHESAFFRLSESEKVTGRPSFLGGVSGSSPPFYVNSTETIKFLNADMVDGLHGSSFATSSHNHSGVYSLLSHNHSGVYALYSHSHGSLYFTETESDNRFVNITGDSMTGPLDAAYNTSLNYAVKGIGQHSPTLGYMGVQGQTDFDGVTSADWLGREIGVAGISAGTTNSDNYGVLGHSNYIGVRGEYSGSPSTDYGELGKISRGVVGKTSYSTGRGVEGVASNSGDYTNYGGHFTAYGDDGRGAYGYANGTNGIGIYGNGSGSSGRGVYGYASGSAGRGIYGKVDSTASGLKYAGYFECNNSGGYGVYASVNGTSSTNWAVRGEATGTNSSGAWFSTTAEDRTAILARALGTSGSWNSNVGGHFTAAGNHGTGVKAIADGQYGLGLFASGGTDGYAAQFHGNVKITSQSSGLTVMELGDGLDYAEGFDVKRPELIEPGTVLIIDPDSSGRLCMSKKAYDTRVAGIVAGAEGLGSGVRLGGDRFDHDVALAGRVYCNVDATETKVRLGDLLTTAGLPGYAMRASDRDRSHGAILGKAMQSLEKGSKGKILVLVTLQ